MNETDSKGKRRWNPDDLLRENQLSGIEQFHQGIITTGAQRAVATTIRRVKRE